MCGIIGYVGPRECKPLLLHGLERLEYRGYDSAGIALLEEGGLDYVRAVGPLANLKSRAGSNGSTATTGPRTHALGDARWGHRGERAPARRLRGLEGLDRPQRHRRELPRAHGEPRRRGAHVQLRDRRRDGDASHRAPLRGRPGRGCAARLRRARGPLRVRRDPPRPSGPSRRRAPAGCRSSSASARTRCSSRRTRPRSSARRASSSSPVTARSSPCDTRARRSSASTAPRSSTSRPSSTGTTRERRRRATRRSCSRRSTSSPRPSPRPSATGFATGRLVLEGLNMSGRTSRSSAGSSSSPRHGVPRVCRRPVRHRGVGARPGRVRHRERVDLPEPGDQRARPRHRDHPVRRDARHDQALELAREAGRKHRRDHEHDGLAGHARGRLGAVHASRPRDGRRRIQDVHRAGRAPLPRRAEARADPRDTAARRDRVHSRLRLQAAEQDPGSSSTATTRSRRSRSATTTRTSSSTSAVTSGCRRARGRA